VEKLVIHIIPYFGNYIKGGSDARGAGPRPFNLKFFPSLHDIPNIDSHVISNLAVTWLQ
jgi:hypothetical protein